MSSDQAIPPLLTLRDARGETLVSTSRQWPAKRRDILRRVAPAFEYSAPVPPLDPQAPLQVEREGFVEQRVGYHAEIGRLQQGTLYLPLPLAHRQPAVLCCVGDGNTAATIGKELAKRKFVALLPDQGGGEGAAKTLWSHQRALDFLCHLDAVDSDRLAAIGQGLGGANALILTAFDHRIKAVAAACAYEPFVVGGGRLNGPLQLPPSPPFEWVELLGLIAPRAFHYTHALKDEHLPHVEAVREDLVELGRLYDLLGCREKFSIFESPDGHGYPTAARREAYAVFKRVLQEGR